RNRATSVGTAIARVAVATMAPAQNAAACVARDMGATVSRGARRRVLVVQRSALLRCLERTIRTCGENVDVIVAVSVIESVVVAALVNGTATVAVFAAVSEHATSDGRLSKPSCTSAARLGRCTHVPGLKCHPCTRFAPADRCYANEAR